MNRQDDFSNYNNQPIYHNAYHEFMKYEVNLVGVHIGLHLEPGVKHAFTFETQIPINSPPT